MKIPLPFIPIIVLSIISAGCSSEKTPSFLDDISDIPPIDNIEFTPEEAIANEALNKLSFDLFKRTCVLSQENGGNVLISPFGAAISVAMIANGCDDATEAKLKETFGYNSLADLNSTCNKLLRFIPSWNIGAQMSIGNSIWANASVPTANYTDLMKNLYYAETNTIDFENASLTDMVNSWCSTKSHGKIAGFERLRSADNLLLANTFFFDGYWMKGFDKALTEKDKFNGLHRDTDIEMMHWNYGGWSYDFEKAKGLVLNLDGNGAVVFLIPKDGVTIDELAQSFTYEEWVNRDTQDYMTIRSIHLALPKFTMECETSIGYALGDMGLLPTNANLGTAGLGTPNSISVQQKTKVVIDEEGVPQNSSNTTSRPGTSDYENMDYTTRRMTFNKPFLFFVTSYLPRTIILAGKVVDLD